MRIILEYHYDPKSGLIWEAIPSRTMKIHPKDSLFRANYARVVTSFHTMQAVWMCMDEALRMENVVLFKHAMKIGRTLLEKCWMERDGLQGLMGNYRPDQKDPLADPPVLTKYEDSNGIHSDYVMKEVFIFLLLTLEHDPDARWAADWFDRAFT